MASTSEFPDSKLAVARLRVEALIERVCQTSFVERSYTETFDGDGTSILALGHPYLRSVTSIAVGGVSFTTTELADVAIYTDLDYIARRSGVFAYGRRNVVVTYAAGYSATPPQDLKDAALDLARYNLLGDTSGISRRALGLDNEFGNIRFSTANSDDRPTGLPDIDAVIVGWRDTVRIPGIA